MVVVVGYLEVVLTQVCLYAHNFVSKKGKKNYWKQFVYFHVLACLQLHIKHRGIIVVLHEAWNTFFLSE